MRYVGAALAVLVVTIMPIVSLGFVAYPSMWVWDLGLNSEPGEYIEAIPVWNCQAVGYLSGGLWTFLGIDIRFGRMSFARAKILDMVWNWIAGRGVQFALAWLTYHVFVASLMRTAEITHVSYDLFTSLSLFSARPGCLWDIGKGLFSIRGVRIKFIMAWLLFSTIYLAAFPSLLDVMSGYEGSIRTEMLLPNKTTLDLTGVTTLNGLLYYSPCDNTSAPAYDHSMCTSGMSEQDPSTYIFYDSYLNSTWKSYTEGELSPNKTLGSFYTQNASNYNCVAEQNVYQWGFSGEWVLVVICINSFWIFGLWILWLDTELKSQLVRAGRRMGTYRAIADISEAMREDLGDNLCAYSDRELASAVKRRGPVKYYVTEGKGDEPSRIGLSSRRSEKVEVAWGKEYG